MTVEPPRPGYAHQPGVVVVRAVATTKPRVVHHYVHATPQTKMKRYYGGICAIQQADGSLALLIGALDCDCAARR